MQPDCRSWNRRLRKSWSPNPFIRCNKNPFQFSTRQAANFLMSLISKWALETAPSLVRSAQPSQSYGGDSGRPPPLCSPSRWHSARGPGPPRSAACASSSDPAPGPSVRVRPSRTSPSRRTGGFAPECGEWVGSPFLHLPGQLSPISVGPAPPGHRTRPTDRYKYLRTKLCPPPSLLPTTCGSIPWTHGFRRRGCDPEQRTRSSEHRADSEKKQEREDKAARVCRSGHWSQTHMRRCVPGPRAARGPLCSGPLPVRPQLWPHVVITALAFPQDPPLTLTWPQDCLLPEQTNVLRKTKQNNKINNTKTLALPAPSPGPGAVRRTPTLFPPPSSEQEHRPLREPPSSSAGKTTSKATLGTPSLPDEPACLAGGPSPRCGAPGAPALRTGPLPGTRAQPPSTARPPCPPGPVTHVSPRQLTHSLPLPKSLAFCVFL